MQENQTDLLPYDLIQHTTTPRKKMLPLWIKIFAWIFLVISAFVPIILALRLIGYNSQLALYGLETNEPFSLLGIIITTFFIIKGVTSFGLLKEKDWAIKIGIIDAFLGIVTCTLLMFYPIINPDVIFVLRLELIALIPYLLQLLKVKNQWESFARI